MTELILTDWFIPVVYFCAAIALILTAIIAFHIGGRVALVTHFDKIVSDHKDVAAAHESIAKRERDHPARNNIAIDLALNLKYIESDLESFEENESKIRVFAAKWREYYQFDNKTKLMTLRD